MIQLISSNVSVSFCLLRQASVNLAGNILVRPKLSLTISSHFYSKMSKPKVYVTRSVNEEALNLLKKHCEVAVWTGQGPVPRNELLENVENKNALFCMLTDKIDAEVLDKAGPNLKTIATMSVGYDHLDVKAIKQRGIRIGYTPEILTDATAELTIALLLSASRRLLEANEEAKNGGWKAWAPFWMCGQGICKSTVGIVGFGKIAQEVAKRIQPFKPEKMIYWNRSVRKEAQEMGVLKVDFDVLLKESDFIIVTVALTPETKHMFNDDAFKKMKRNCIFINTARGDVVDQDALIRALTNKIIGAAGLDVTTPEPLPLDSPLLKLKNCVILPHIGSACLRTRNEMAVATAENIVAGLTGQKMPYELNV